MSETSEAVEVTAEEHAEADDHAEPGVQLCSLVARLNQRLDAHLREVAEKLGITASQAVALRELSQPMPLKELASRMSCEASNAGYVIDRMETHNLVTRHPHPSDRRVKQLVLTDAGIKLRTHVLEALSEGAPINVLSEDEQTRLSELIRKAAN